jgi:hypothetical protein
MAKNLKLLATQNSIMAIRRQIMVDAPKNMATDRWYGKHVSWAGGHAESLGT